jgi:sigma-E factor negative regulatory protein RseA
MKEQLSALIDGEFEIESSEHIITSVKSGGELKEAWQQYYLIGDAMRGDCRMHCDFSVRVMQALEAEPVVLAVNKGKASGNIHVNQSRYKTHKFWSIAASVAAVMFVGLMLLQQQFNQPESITPVEIAQNLPVEYLAAHQAAAPSSSAYYIQTASYTEQQK